MTSLTNLLQSSGAALPRERSVVEPVLAVIRRRRARRAVWLYRIAIAGFTIALAVVAIASAGSNIGHVVALAAHRLHSVADYPALYLRAGLEAAPWLAIISLAGLGLGLVFIKRYQLALAHFRSRTVIASLGALLVAGATSATALATIDNQPGPAQLKLERMVNAVGAATVIIDGRQYEFNTGTLFSDAQLQAHNELQRIYEWTHNNVTLTPILQHDGDTVLARVVATGPTSLSYVEVNTAGQSGAIIQQVIDGDTKYYAAGQLPESLTLQPGDLIEIALRTSGGAGLIARLQLNLADYLASGNITEWPTQHGSNGRCYNTPADACPDLPATYNIWTKTMLILPAEAKIREVFGRVTTITPTVVHVVTSSGQTWTFNIGPEIAVYNQSHTGPQLQAGDLVRIQFWQHATEQSSHTVNSEQPTPGGQPETKAQAFALQSGQITSDQLRENPIQMVQIALQQPWEPGSAGVKY